MLSWSPTLHLSLLDHHPVGMSTGVFFEARGDWPWLIELARSHSSFVTELAALSEPELPSLVQYLSAAEEPPFGFLSVHAPSKHRSMPDRDLVAMLRALPAYVDAIVVHPDTIVDVDAYRELGRKLVLENLDMRKPTGRTTDELIGFFAALPDAGLCFDVPHAADVDRSLADAHRLLDRFADRLRHVHVSSLDDAGHHVPLTAVDERAFAPILRRCSDVPWILEAPLRSP